MSKIKTDTETLKDIHDKITAEGKLYLGQSNEKFVGDYIIGVEEDHIRTVGLSSDVAVVDARFEDVEVIEEGTIPVINAGKFEDVLNRFEPDDEITVGVQEKDGKTLLRVRRDQPEKEFYVKSGSPDTIDSWQGAMEFRQRIEYDGDEDSYYTIIGEDQEKRVESGQLSEDNFYDFDNGISNMMDAKITIRSEELGEVIEDAVVTDAGSFPLEVENGEFIVDLGNEIDGGVKTVPVVESVRGEAMSEYQYGLDGILKNNYGELHLYFGDSTPVVIENEGENHNVKYIIAPMNR